MIPCLIFFRVALALVGFPYWSLEGPRVIIWEVSLGPSVSGFFLSFCLDSWRIGFGLVMSFVASHVY